MEGEWILPKSSEAKVDLAKQLLKAGVPYREIQELLKKTYGSGMSYTTFQKLIEKQNEQDLLKQELELCKVELEKTTNDLALYKHLYNDLLLAIKNQKKTK